MNYQCSNLCQIQNWKWLPERRNLIQPITVEVELTMVGSSQSFSINKIGFIQFCRNRGRKNKAKTAGTEIQNLRA